MTFNPFLLATAVIAAQPALAHETVKGPNGGKVVDAGITMSNSSPSTATWRCS